MNASQLHGFSMTFQNLCRWYAIVLLVHILMLFYFNKTLLNNNFVSTV